MPDLASLLSIAAGVLVVTVALVGFLGWRLSRPFVYGDQHFIRLDAVSLTLASVDLSSGPPVKQDGPPRRYQPMPLADLA